MFDYTLNASANSEVFSDVCKKIEQAFLDYRKDDLLTDVDGSQIQIYYLQGSKTVVYDDYYVDTVYVKSERNLDKLFV